MGKYVDKYCLIEELKHMEHCQIYKGQERTTKQDVFIKVFSLKFIEKNKTLHQKVLNEMTIIESNDFPFIVKALSYLKTTNNMYHVYEYFPQGSLKESIAKGPMPFEEAVSKLRKILECVSSLHANNIIHRNLKPSALLLKGQELFLTNFLNAIQLENPEMSNDEVYGGSFVYRAPEAFFAPLFSKKSDVYSVGVIFYELLFGMPPFSEGQILAGNGTVPSIDIRGNLRVSKLPAAIEELLGRLLAKSPAQRFQPKEAIALIDAKILTTAISNAPLTANEQPEKFVVALFKKFLGKTDFLNEMGDLLVDGFIELDSGAYLSYVVLKKLYLLVRGFKKFIGFDSLRLATPMASKIILTREFREIEDFVERIERESLAQLIMYQNALIKNFNSRVYKELGKDLETLDDFKNWEKVRKDVIEPFVEQVRNFSPDALILTKTAIFVKNVEENVFSEVEWQLLQEV